MDTPAQTGGGARTPLVLDVECDKKLNFAMHHNAVPLVGRLSVTNCGPPRSDVDVVIRTSPEISSPWQRRIEQLGNGGTYSFDIVNPQLHAAKLANITERETVELVVEARHDDVALSRVSIPVEVLAFNEWNGVTSLPQLLAAFVQPNHPVVQEAVAIVKDLLGRRTGDPSLGAYQTKDGGRVRQIVAAVYGAVGQLGITYVNPPPSFETTGQKVRTPEQLLQGGVGTCLDLSVFAAALLEQVGLHPLVVVVEGHAFVGAWLIEDQMPEGVCDEALRLRKLNEVQELCLFDSSPMVATPPVPFEDAERAAVRYLDQNQGLLYAVDVRSARDEKILPLPSRTIKETYGIADSAVKSRPIARNVTELLQRAAARTPEDESVSAPVELKATPVTRIERWKEKLLDLSLRNRLLNYRETKTSLQLLTPDLPALEDALAAGRSFSIHPRPSTLKEADPRSEVLLAARDDEAAEQARLRDAQSRGRLFGACSEGELSRRIKEMARTARVSLEEGGANILYVALGFLKWFEAASSDKPRLAPLVLLPAQLRRRSAREGYELAQFDDEARINVTLLEKLRKDFEVDLSTIADPPTDDSGLDIPLILDTVRKAIARIDRWEVLEEAHLGLFSFTKFLMWNDLEVRTASLLENHVVQHLALHSRDAFPDQGEFPEAGALDARMKPAETYCPLDADSSQLVAVRAAADGKTFILEGPPGTGKSQTITNLITHCLAHRQSVLFVSEKMAALDVVHRRLEKVGLGGFCLELHSNKASKKQVLDHLGKTLHAASVAQPAAWDELARAVETSRDRLNAYAHRLHLPRDIGFSYFNGISYLIGLESVPKVRVDFGPSSSAVEAERLATIREAVERLATAAEPLGAVHESPWRSVALDSWSAATQEAVTSAIERTRAQLGVATKAAELAGKVLELEHRHWSWAELHRMRDVAALLLRSPRPSQSLMAAPEWEDTEHRIQSWIAHGRRRDELHQTLSARYSDDLHRLDVAGLRARFARWAQAFFLVAFFMLFFARRTVKKVCKARPLPANRQIAEDLDTAVSLTEEQGHLHAISPQASSLLGRFWNEGQPDWSALGQVVEWVSRFRVALARLLALPQMHDGAAERRQRLIALAGSEDPLDSSDPAGRVLVEFVAATDDLARERSALFELLVVSDDVLGSDHVPDALGRLGELVQRWGRDERSLRNWTFYLKARGECERGGLLPLTKAHAEGQVATCDLRHVFERGFFSWWVERVASEDPVLGEFHSADHVRVAERFRQADRQLCEATKQMACARLCGDVPHATDAAASSSDLGILLRELKKKRAHMPLRRLFHKMPHLLRRLSPCMLMSPLSVAQYLDPDHPSFDLVVFDEASQIPVHDAIGAIARGRQLVVVGDPKQLPPTSFFSRVETDDEEGAPSDDDITELESVLDECIAARLPRLQLRWHYRSRHEHLIAFSNYHYYNNNLQTFPSGVDKHQWFGVEWQPVDGYYDKGKSRTNQAEARAVVDRLVTMLTDREQQSRSVGIVTFSQAQQRLIEDLIDDARQKNPSIEPFFENDVAEPVFVKNLENVQGDERDVMLFSICYGPDMTGRVSMNFGPLNRDGGERRLNVAVTRAREKLVIFSTLTPEKIELRRTRAQGARHLKAFLEYAQRGPKAIAEAVTISADADVESPFEAEVLESLTARGWVVVPQVGCSGYRVDLGVVDPDAPGRFLLGIECDGAHYHSASTARDRDRLRQQVLESLGWTIHRIWSTDWWHDPGTEIVKVEASLERAKTRRDRQLVVNRTNTSPSKGGPSRIRQLVASDAPRPAAPAVQKPAAPAIGQTYQAVTTQSVPDDPDSFYAPNRAGTIQHRLVQIVAKEAPIHEKLLAKRLSEPFGVKRVTQRVLSRVATLAQSGAARAQVFRKDDFYWRVGQDTSNFTAVRVPSKSDESTVRPIEQISLHELANAAFAILERNIAIDRSELIRETARLFGVNRTGQRVTQRLDAAIDHLALKGRCVAEGDRVRVVEHV